jgi:heat shock protein 5
MNGKVVVGVVLLAVLAMSADEQPKYECPIIGIDLGTTYSCVGIYKNGQVEIIPNELGNRITPSVVAFTDEERLIGEAAKNQATVNPTRTLYDVKRLIGRRYSDQTVQYDKKYLPYDIVEKDTRPYI